MVPKRNLIRNFYKAYLEPRYAIRAFMKRFYSFLSYHFAKDGYAVYPESLTFFLTYRCNLRCRMCGQWGESGISNVYYRDSIKEELSLDVWERLLEGVSSFKPHITLFGGEPFLYEGIKDLVKLIKNKRLHLCIISNGTLLSQNASWIVEYKVDEISVSVDGPAWLHNSIRGINKGFEKIKEGIKAINEEKAKFKKYLPIINLVCTISSLNYYHLQEMLAIASEFKAHTLNYHHLIFLEKELLEKHNELFKRLFSISSKDWAGFLLKETKKIDPGYLIKVIQDIKKRKNKFLVNFYPNFDIPDIKNYYSQKEFIPKSYASRCLSPWMVAYIYPDGTLRPCLSLDYIVGNIKYESFKKLWNNARFRYFRKILKEKKFFPVCPRCTEFYRF